MKKYRSNADSPVRTDYGIALVAGLGFFTETKGYAGSFKTLNDELDAAYVARRAARKPLVEKRARFRFAHYNVDQMIRMAYQAAQVADGGRRGPLTEALFEDGLGPVIALGIARVRIWSSLWWRTAATPPRARGRLKASATALKPAGRARAKPLRAASPVDRAIRNSASRYGVERWAAPPRSGWRYCTGGRIAPMRSWPPFFTPKCTYFRLRDSEAR